MVTFLKDIREHGGGGGGGGGEWGGVGGGGEGVVFMKRSSVGLERWLRC